MASDFSVIEATADGSHLRFIDAFTNHTESAYREIVAIYDTAIQNDPKNPLLLLEKCKFIEGAFPMNYDDGRRDQPELDAAISLLAERFPEDPESVLYRSERLQGEEQINLLERFANPELAGWNDGQRARLLESLAWAYYSDDDLTKANSRAQSATKLDPSRDLSLVVASYYDSIGRPELAAKSLVKYLESETEPWKKNRKAQLLSKVGRPAEAVKLYESLRTRKEFFVNPFDYADALERAGQVETARAELTKATEASWQAEKARGKLFDFEIKHGDAKSALEAYRTLCADGLGTDSLLRRRLILSGTYPSAPWAWTDFARLGLLGAVTMLLVVLPLTWIIPVHYIGLLRARKASPKPADEHLWHLGHFWWVSAIWLCATFFCIYWFNYDEFARFLTDDETLEFVFNPKHLAATALTFLVIFSTGTLIIQRKRHWLLAIKSPWGGLRTVLTACAAVILLKISFRAMSLLFDLTGGTSASAMNPMLGAVSSRVQMIFALGSEYGIGVLFLWVVILTPLTEELVFRGIILDSVGRHLPFHVANLGQALLFAAIHEEPSQFWYFVLFGWIAGMMRRMSNGLALPLCFHAANNLLSFVQIAVRLP